MKALQNKSIYMIFKKFIPVILLLLFAGSCTFDTKDQEIGEKVEILLKQMTIEEKIGQMTQACLSNITLNGNKNLDMNPDLFREAIINQHIGSFISGTGPAQKWIDFITELQRVAVTESRLGIPLLIGIDHVHGGNYIDEGTIFPHNITLSCSFDTSLICRGAAITAVETLAAGINWNFAPVCDIGKNPYWPRFYETFGEDPYVCGIMSAAYIRAQQDSISGENRLLATTAKHFIGYSDPKSGWDRTPAEIPDQILFEQFLPPFRMAVDAGVKTVMVNSGEVNGVPVHVSKKLLTKILRDELNFKGVLVTDIKDIMKVHEEHKGAETEKTATLMALDAGIDISMACNSYDFITLTKELIDEGEISEDRIDESVRRILRMKFELGLFDNPYPPKSNEFGSFRKAHLDESQRMAEASIVLLKNKDQILPLSRGAQRILVSGPGADSKRMLNGAWTLEWMGAEESRQPKEMNSLFQALSEEFTEKKISHFETGSDSKQFSEKSYMKALEQNDLVILVLGEQPYSEFKGNISDLTLPAEQLELARMAYDMGKQLIIVLIEGRPRTITSIEPYASAVIFAGYPGERGAEALSGIISGRVNPSGKLSFSYPMFPGHFTPYYHKNFDKSENLYAFGHGMSYTEFEYSQLSLSDTLLHSPDQNLTISVKLKNTGKREGAETLLFFFRDEKGKITRPVKQLFHFDKINLLPGQEKTVSVSIVPADIFSYPDDKNNWAMEEGEFTLLIGDLQKSLRFLRD